MAEFDSFVIFAEMRTGSNLLEATLNKVKRVTCFGEAFNPHMLGWPDTDRIRGVTLAEREEDPQRLLDALWDRPDHLTGFRYFHDHDPRVLPAIMENRRCAKIVLTRNPVDSYVSTELARLTDQWKLNETETPIPARITYDGAAFRDMLDAVQQFQLTMLHRLQSSGQSAFWLNYDDLRDRDVMTGLVHWLGRTDIAQLDPATDQVPQNPRPMAEKVVNIDEMRADLAELDPFLLGRVPTFEPRRGPAVPSFVACDGGGGLLFMPVRGGPTGGVLAWMEAAGPLQRDFRQASLRTWLRAHPRHRSFTVLRHPLLRAHAAFRQLIEGNQQELRHYLRETQRVALPEEGAPLDPEAEQAAFAGFLGFLRRNLNGQTSQPVLPIWASQGEVLAGFARHLSPDMVIREDRLQEDLAYLAAAVDLPVERLPTPAPVPEFLRDRALLQAARAAYQRDYVQFGFTNQI